MTPTWLLKALILAALTLALLGAALRARRWFQGGPARVDAWRGVMALPRRYLVDVHDVVARDRYAAFMHVMVAGGFAAALVLILLVQLLGIEARVLAWASLLALAVMALGGALVAWRRLEAMPARLSKGGFNRLSASLIVFALAFALATLPAAGVVPPGAWSAGATAVIAVLVAWGLFEMFVGATWGGPMKHAFAGALYLVCHPRPGRFSGAKLDTGLRFLDLEAPKLGVETPRDFPWNHLLGFDACVQCGRCEAACPAFAAGQPLNPKKLIQDLVVGMAGGSDCTYRGSPHPGRRVGEARGGPERPIVGDLIHADTLWACTTCRACVYECPMMIEHLDAIIELRRFETLEKGATPGQGAEALEELRNADNPGGHDPASRLDWAADLALPKLAEKGAADVLLWLGDGAFDPRGQRTLRALVKLMRAAEVDFAVLGSEELDCGDLARRLGDEATFQDLARRTIQALAKYRLNAIVTADPHAFHCLKNEYPHLGGHYRVFHHTTFLAGLVRDGRLKMGRREGLAVTYHDPCYLGRYNGEVEAPRELLRTIGVEVREMERSGMRSRCCGGGGGAPLTDVPGETRIPDIRMEDARATGAGVVAVACPTCAVMLEGVIAPRPEVADVAELLVEAVEA